MTIQKDKLPHFLLNNHYLNNNHHYKLNNNIQSIQLNSYHRKSKLRENLNEKLQPSDVVLHFVIVTFASSKFADRDPQTLKFSLKFACFYALLLLHTRPMFTPLFLNVKGGFLNCPVHQILFVF